MSKGYINVVRSYVSSTGIKHPFGFSKVMSNGILMLLDLIRHPWYQSHRFVYKWAYEKGVLPTTQIAFKIFAKRV